jgi:hypothetical protein
MESLQYHTDQFSEVLGEATIKLTSDEIVRCQDMLYDAVLSSWVTGNVLETSRRLNVLMGYTDQFSNVLGKTSAEVKQAVWREGPKRELVQQQASC